MLILFKEAVVELDEVRGWQFFKEKGFFLSLHLHVVVYMLAHEYALKSHHDGHLARSCLSLICEANEINLSETTRAELLHDDKVAELELLQRFGYFLGACARERVDSSRRLSGRDCL